MSRSRSASDFRRQPDTRARGRLGEREAEAWLRARGYRIVDRNVVMRGGEIDLIGEHHGVLCFIEVKARANRAFGSAIEAIPPNKQRRIARAAQLYLVRHPTSAPCRFDVLAMDLESGDGDHQGASWRYTLVTDAFSIG